MDGETNNIQNENSAVRETADLQTKDEQNWCALPPIQRRILGALMEKSKTTPDAYPMSFTGLTTACNQKSNRHPATSYDKDEVERAVDELKTLGAVTIVYGNGRATKVRHYGYDWLGLSKVEAAVMTELLLRGEQKLGELRSRASRLEPIADQQTLMELLEGLEQKSLVLFLTPAGRGQIVSHNLYPENELVHVRKVANRSVGSDSADRLDSASSEATEAVGNENLSNKVLLQKIEELEARVAKIEQLLE